MNSTLLNANNLKELCGDGGDLVWTIITGKSNSRTKHGMEEL